MVNLFERIAEPVRISQTKTEYLIVPDLHRQSSTEIYSVDRVTSTASYMEEPQTYQPFYALRHGRDEGQRHFWHTHRRPSFRKHDSGTEVYISLVDLDFNPALPPAEMLTLRVTCTNRDQASHLKWTGEFGELEVEGAALVQALCLRKPTQTVRPPQRRGLEWRLISHLSLNHLSIVEKGREATAGDPESVRFLERSCCPEADRRHRRRDQPFFHQQGDFRYGRRLLPRHGCNVGF